jgi:beta-aspartyl-peptidase (threonine type)
MVPTIGLTGDVMLGLPSTGLHTNGYSLARKVLDASNHVFLISEGAEDFARAQKLEMVENSHFSTDYRRQQLQKARESGSTRLDHDGERENRLGTVGAVAADQYGNVAAATSSGGITNKRYGRVGDSAVIGAGTYADNKSCAVSCTGTGEHFIRLSAAHNVTALMKYLNLTISEACSRLVFEQLPELGGKGGLIAVDPLGNVETPFNTSGMYRASFQQGGKITVRLYADD